MQQILLIRTTLLPLYLRDSFLQTLDLFSDNRLANPQEITPPFFPPSTASSYFKYKQQFIFPGKSYLLILATVALQPVPKNKEKAKRRIAVLLLVIFLSSPWPKSSPLYTHYLVACVIWAS